jgi:hypothetical protein
MFKGECEETEFIFVYCKHFLVMMEYKITSSKNPPNWLFSLK